MRVITIFRSRFVSLNRSHEEKPQTVSDVDTPLSSSRAISHTHLLTFMTGRQVALGVTWPE